jgi:hypothetical protein
LMRGLVSRLFIVHLLCHPHGVSAVFTRSGSRRDGRRA